MRRDKILDSLEHERIICATVNTARNLSNVSTIHREDRLELLSLVCYLVSNVVAIRDTLETVYTVSQQTIVERVLSLAKEYS